MSATKIVRKLYASRTAQLQVELRQIQHALGKGALTREQSVDRIRAAFTKYLPDGLGEGTRFASSTLSGV